MAPYLVPADFRKASLNPACEGLELTDDMANDQRLTTAIATIQQRIEDKTGDFFTKSAGLVLEHDVYGYTGRLYLKRRCTAVTTVKTRFYDGTLTTQDAGPTPPAPYRFYSSLDSTGAVRIADNDYLELVPYGPGLQGVYTGLWTWPPGTQTVQVTGDFGWTVTPGDIKRATALYVWDLFFKQAGDLGRVKAFTRGDIRVEQADGMPEADAILANYMRESPVMIG